MNIGSSIIYSTALAGIVAMIVLGITSCDERETKVRSECIQAGGTVILSSGSQSTHCIRK